MKRVMKYINSSLNVKVLVITGIILVSTVTVTLCFINRRHERLLLQQVESQARILFKQIVLTRRWIADHGGIFVEKLPWVKKNPYLEKSEIIDIEGKRYIKENPAFVTRELSKYSKREGLYWFHITSLRLVNPSNAPDQFERKALKLFEEEGVKEVSTLETIDKSRYFRYIAPLYIEPSCRKCHRNYKLGDVRGAISVTMPVDYLITQIYKNRMDMIIGTIVISSLLLITLFFSVRKLVIKPVSQLEKAIEDFSKGRESNYTINSDDEIGKLYRAFINMRDTITEYQSTLKERIDEATEELQVTNERLIEANRLYRELSERKSDFIANISHELRTPLTSVKGAIDYINTRLTMLKSKNINCDISDVFKFLAIIGSNTERLVRMVNDTLDLEKIESGKMEFHFDLLELGRVINYIIAEITPLYDTKNIVINATVDKGLYVCGDDDRLRQVLTNLLTNAIKYSPEGSEIRVYGTRKDGFVEVRIEDQGKGIPPGDEERIFDKFYKGKDGGTGLGLAISKSIIEGHGGEIGIASNGSKGSTFYFRLKAVDIKNGQQIDTSC
jgi:signal transduction histidine kinase